MKILSKRIAIGAFWILLIFSLFSIIKTFFTYPYNFNIRNLTTTLSPIVVNFELKQKIDNNKIFTCFDEYCSSTDSDLFKNVYSYKFDYNNSNFFFHRIKSIKIAYPKAYSKLEIEKIIISVGNKNLYYSKDDISKFQKKECKIQLDDSKENKDYIALILPQVDNYRGFLNHFSIIILSLFYNWTIFIIPYFWLFVALLIYLFNKDYFNFKLNNRFILPILIIILTIVFRLNGLTYFPLWSDEIYTKAIAIDNFKSVFQDAGNLPLFYLIEFFFTKIFTNNIFVLRFVPFLFGIGLIPVVYILLKNISKKLALFASFLASINIIFIYYSQEARCFSLCIFLSILAIYILFKYLKNPNNKNLIYYLLVSICLINSSYYMVILFFTNCIWGLVDLIENKNKNKILPFLLVNILSILTIVPYLIVSYKKALSPYFNTWIPTLDKNVILSVINHYFLNKYVFLFLSVVVFLNLIICFIPKIKVNKEKENLYIYLIYTLTSILIIASMVSIFIKPIIQMRILISLYGILFLIEIITISSLIEIEKDNKWLISAKTVYMIILLGFYFNLASPINARGTTGMDNLMFLIQKEASYYHSLGYEIHGVIPDYKEYIKAYPEVLKLDYITWHTTKSNSGYFQKHIDKKQYTESNDKVVIFISPIGMDIKIPSLDPRLHIYDSNILPAIKLISEGTK